MTCELADLFSSRDYTLICLSKLDLPQKLDGLLVSKWDVLAHPLLKCNSVKCLTHVHSEHPEYFDKILLDMAASLCNVRTFTVMCKLCNDCFDASTICKASETNNVDTVEYLLDRNCPHDARCIVYPCRMGHLSLVKRLIDRGLKITYVCLASAGNVGRICMLWYLLQKGGEVMKTFSEVIMAGACSFYTTKCLAMLVYHCEAVTKQHLKLCVQYRNAVALTLCLWNCDRSKVYLKKKQLRKSFRRESGMVQYVLHKLHSVDYSEDMVLEAAAHGNIKGIIHYSVATGTFKRSACMGRIYEEMQKLKALHCTPTLLEDEAYMPHIKVFWQCALPIRG